MRKLKKITMLFLLTFMISTNVSAKELDGEYMNYIRENGGNDITISDEGNIVYSDDYLNVMSEKEAQVEKSLKKYNKMHSYSMNNSKIIDEQVITDNFKINGICYDKKTLGVKAVKQETNYYCGPAAVKEVLQFINGESLSQYTYANNMQTDSSGTYVYRVTNELNYRQSRHQYRHQTDLSYDQFVKIIISDILDSDVGVPFILHARTASLYMYNNSDIRHYLVVSGGNMITKKGTYIDSWDKDYGRGTVFGKHTDSYLNLYNTISSSGRFVIW